MLQRKVKRLFPLDIQFFADDNNGDNGDGQNNGQNGSSGSDGQQKDNSTQNKTFTQEQVNNMMAKEKNEGRRAVLKTLGFKSEDEAKEAIKLYNALIDSQKSEEEKNQENLQKANEEREEYRLRAEEAENKVLCLEYGVDKNSIEDVLAIAKTKVTEKNSLESVLKSMEKDSKYASFFSKGQSNGTGREPGHSGSNGGGFSNYGKELAERTVSRNNGEKKSSFF